MKIEFSYVDFGQPVFSKGTNFGNKINAAQKGAKIWHDTEIDKTFMLYKGHLTIFNGFFSGDVIDPEAMLEAQGVVDVVAPVKHVVVPSIIAEPVTSKLTGKNKTKRPELAGAQGE